ncbi:uncharacterized protein FIBRA_07554 [Fibroporia radiculosa]|uniref:Uncharacterized protein n=1 Tax=Fibroporia radiculosa TaxID=599839 RepID=J4GV75_9APHY|nr:uncharacterized protein FIBRA_07554 [Fibroporia radiculosa]CCM05340.1 predicted protein [Fibroporia radiculosa]
MAGRSASLARRLWHQDSPPRLDGARTGEDGEDELDEVDSLRKWMGEDAVDSEPALNASRSVSRGREFHSSGRGGVGNIRRTSKDPASPPSPASPGSDRDFSVTRGREPAPSSDRVLTTGRGGVGNIRSGSAARSVSRASAESHPKTASLLADMAHQEAEYERGLLRLSEEAARAGKHSSGRGGVGNIKSQSKSKSKTRTNSRNKDGLRSPSRGPVHSSGRGGAGNVVAGSTEDAEYNEELDNEEMERAKAHHPEGMCALHWARRPRKLDVFDHPDAISSPQPTRHANAPSPTQYRVDGARGSGQHLPVALAQRIKGSRTRAGGHLEARRTLTDAY